MKPFSIVVAIDDKNGIGKNNDLAWRLSADLKRFKEITTQVGDPAKKNAVLMGRKTWDSLPEKFRPLPGRLNVVLSHNPDVKLPDGVLLYSDLDSALKDLKAHQGVDKLFIIGGAQIFTLYINHPACRELFVTHIKGDFTCDTFFPAIPSSFKVIEESPWLTEGQLQYRFSRYQKI